MKKIEESWQSSRQKPPKEIHFRQLNQITQHGNLGIVRPWFRVDSYKTIWV